MTLSAAGGEGGEEHKKATCVYTHWGTCKNGHGRTVTITTSWTQPNAKSLESRSIKCSLRTQGFVISESEDNNIDQS